MMKEKSGPYWLKREVPKTRGISRFVAVPAVMAIKMPRNT
jgi:hypothetical protein